MSTNFSDAFNRHFNDAELLLEKQRLANASQLYGLAAECGLKALMIKFGMPLSGNLPQDKKDRVHADGAWQRYESYRSDYISGAGYGLTTQNPFSAWSIHQRYWKSSCITVQAVNTHQQGAKQVAGLIKKAQLAGLL